MGNENYSIKSKWIWKYKTNVLKQLYALFLESYSVIISGYLFTKLEWTNDELKQLNYSHRNTFSNDNTHQSIILLQSKIFICITNVSNFFSFYIFLFIPLIPFCPLHGHHSAGTLSVVTEKTVFLLQYMLMYYKMN